MKNLYIYMLLSILVVGIMSCKDNQDFFKPHILTDAEIAEIARQDSIEKAQREMINANLILNYSLELQTSASQYSGEMVDIEMDKLAELFELSEAEILAGIAGESGAPEIKGFAIEGSTHADNMTASTTNAPWGHWWDIKGDVTSWGDDAMLFAEFDTENGAFFVGQYPGHLVDGDTIKFVEALKYNELRAAVVITVYPKAPGQVVASVVSEQDLTVDLTPKSVYDADSVQFDLNKVLSDLGVNSMEEVAFIGVKEDGSYETEAVTGNGFWYDFSGNIGEWGDNAAVYTNYGDFVENYISVGQFPDHLTADMSFTLKYGFMANNKIVMLNVTINVQGYVDPETAPTGDPEALVIDVELAKPYSNDYASVTYDIRETLRNAFKMTTYQIHQAINSGELKLYQGAISEEDPAYTADAPGYWLKEDGTAGGWAESLVWTSIGHNETELWLFGGNHPDNAVAGNVVNTTYIATLNGGSVTINITYTVEGESSDVPQDLTLTYDVSFPVDSVDYTGTSVSLIDNGDIDKVADALLMESSAIEAALLAAQETPQEGKIAFAAVEPDGTLNYATTANGFGFWFDSAGAVIGWGGDNDSKLFSEFTATDFTFSIGQFPGKSGSGDTYTVKEAFVYTKDSVEYQITFVFNITIN